MPEKTFFWIIALIVCCVIIAFLFTCVQESKSEALKALDDKLGKARFRLYQKIRIRDELDFIVKRNSTFASISLFILSGGILYYINLPSWLCIMPLLSYLFNVKLDPLSIEKIVRPLIIKYVYSEAPDLKMEIRNLRIEIKGLVKQRNELLKCAT